jgi:hypothetical protein
MANKKGYIVKRAGHAPRKGGGAVYITRQNQDQIPELLSQATIRERVDAGSFEEIDTGVEDVTPEDVEAAELLESKAGMAGSRSNKKKES